MSTKLEKKIEEIEEIVRQLEDEETDIDRSIEMYERGVKLIRECEKIITQYEDKIKTVLGEESKSDE